MHLKEASSRLIGKEMQPALQRRWMTTPLNSVRFLLIVLLLLPWAAASRGQSAPALSTAQSQALEQQALATEPPTRRNRPGWMRCSTIPANSSTAGKQRKRTAASS